MSTLTIAIDDKVSGHLARLEKKLSRQAMRRALIDITRPLVATMKANAPVKTGALRRSIGYTTRIDRKAGRTSIKVGMKYRRLNRKGYVAGLMQERGTRYMHSQPFIQPSSDIHLPDIEKELSEFIAAQIES